MDSKHLGGLTPVAVVFFQGFSDESPLKLADGVFVGHTVLNHLVD